MKELFCCECKTKVGEINKGKIKTDAVLLCGKCNYQRLLDNNKTQNSCSELDKLSQIFGFKK